MVQDQLQRSADIVGGHVQLVCVVKDQLAPK